MNMKSVILILVLMLTACSQQPTKSQRSFDLMAIAYHRHSAETKALQYQAFNVAKDVLNLQLSKKTTKPKAVVLDIDETILDNSPYQSEANIKDLLFPEGWYEWTAKAVAEPIPGAKEFLNFAANTKVTIFLVTNRSMEEKEATVKNLKEKGFTIDEDKIYFKTTVSSKESRRQEISKKYQIVLSIGDNLADFDALYDVRTWDNRNMATDKLAKNFGRIYIVLPNPMYGDWEGSLYDGKFPKTSEDKNQTLKNIIKARL
jgi:5'-nucleotidase (lipoprotein e(P4) family)